MSSMFFSIEIDPDDPAVKPFALVRGHVLPALELRRETFEAMYAPVIGRPQIDPVALAAILVLQVMERLPNIRCQHQCKYNACWHFALGATPPAFDASTLSHFRTRLMEHKNAHLAFQAGLEAMQKTGHLKRCNKTRVDSTHLLSEIEKLSRLECLRETLRLALDFLAAFNDPQSWEPWHALQ